jgi:hypothetical protein
MRQPQEVTAFLDILIAAEKLNHDAFNPQFTRFFFLLNKLKC